MRIFTLHRFILLCALCIIMTTARAQYVAIPDSNFGNWLNTNGYSGCLTGNGTVGYHLDTTCSAVLTVDSINCIYSNIYDLTGIAHFTSLRSLVCNNNHLSTLPVLPSSIQNLYCFSNSLTGLSGLPSGLKILSCGFNHITALPGLPSGLTQLICGNNTAINTLPSLPSTLAILDCSYCNLNALSALPAGLTQLECEGNAHIHTLGTLPSSLTTLHCSYDSILSIPSLPAVLQYLNCAFCYTLTSLPNLPSTLTTLSCDGNLLTNLPALPASLNTLSCGANSISTIPSLPAGLTSLVTDGNPTHNLPALPSSLTSLSCQSSPLYSLPVLPAGLQYLFCESDSLTALPVLPPSLTFLDCRYNPNLYCLPRVYNYMTNIYIASTGITCLPNEITAGTTDIPAGMPLCDPASGCDFYYNLGGSVHYDVAATCADDSIQPGQFIHNVKVQLLQGGSVIQQFYTFNSGGYSFKTPSLSTYTVDIDTTALPISLVCPASGSRTVALSAIDTLEKYEGFGMQCTSTDFGVSAVQGTHFRAGDTSDIHILAGDLALMNYNAACGAGVSGTVTTTLSAGLAYAGPMAGALTPSSASGGVVTYNISNLGSLQAGSMDIMVTTAVGTIVGSSVCITVHISSSVPDANPSNNTLTQCFDVVNSWDPNDKEVYPLDTFQQGQWLTYTVNFQNTGTDTAYLVVVKDTLSANADASSFEFLQASSKVVIQLFGSAMIFTFPHINLVDSAANAAKSTGWIEYKVKPLSNLTAGTQVRNTAYVYFDSNPAVVTNTTVNTLGAAPPCTDTTIFTAQAICQGDSFTFMSQSLTVAGTYNDTLSRAGGCDSIISLTLRVHALPMVSLSWDSLLGLHDLGAFVPTDTIWCGVLFPPLFQMAGGIPGGGIYSGNCIVNDTFNILYFNDIWSIDTVTYTYTDSNGCSGIAVDYFRITICEGINNIAANTINFYPNPNHGSFTLQTSNSIGSEYTISDMLGDVIAHDVIKENEQVIDMKEAGEGVYTLVLKGANPARFVVMR